jgi:predicted porin
MKATVRNTLLMTSLAAAGMCAHAEGFNFYALLDGGIAHSSISNGGGSKTEFVTGGYAPNFFGMKAEKSMGQGYAAGFNLEQGFLLNKPNGATGNGYEANSRFAFGGDSLFNRQANLYLTSSNGTLKVGTQSNVVFDSLVSADPRFGSNYASSLASVVADGGLNTTDDGAISYTFPATAGVTTTVEYVAQANSGSTMKSGERIAFNYAGNGIKGTLGYYANEGTTTGATSAAAHGVVLGVSKKIGAFDLKALYAEQTAYNSLTSTRFSGLKTTGLGGAYTLTPEVTLDFGSYKTKKDTYSVSTLGFGAQYKFLKDLTLYGQYAQVKNDGTSSAIFNFTPPNDTGFTGVLVGGKTATTINVGFLYSFF